MKKSELLTIPQMWGEPNEGQPWWVSAKLGSRLCLSWDKLSWCPRQGFRYAPPMQVPDVQHDSYQMDIHFLNCPIIVYIPHLNPPPPLDTCATFNVSQDSDPPLWHMCHFQCWSGWPSYHIFSRVPKYLPRLHTLPFFFYICKLHPLQWCNMWRLLHLNLTLALSWLWEGWVTDLSADSYLMCMASIGCADLNTWTNVDCGRRTSSVKLQREILHLDVLLFMPYSAYLASGTYGSEIQGFIVPTTSRNTKWDILFIFAY